MKKRNSLLYVVLILLGAGGIIVIYVPRIEMTVQIPDSTPEPPATTKKETTTQPETEGIRIEWNAECTSYDEKYEFAVLYVKYLGNVRIYNITFQYFNINYYHKTRLPLYFEYAEMRPIPGEGIIATQDVMKEYKSDPQYNHVNVTYSYYADGEIIREMKTVRFKIP